MAVSLNPHGDIPVSPTNMTPLIDVLSNKLVGAVDDELLLNAEPINAGQLVSLFHITQQLEIEPELQFEPEVQASYAASAKALEIVEASGVSRFEFVGNEKYRQYVSGQ